MSIATDPAASTEVGPDIRVDGESTQAMPVAARTALVTLALASGLIPIGLVIAAANRGLDLSDESFYLITMQRPRDYQESSTQFPLLLGVLWDLFPHVFALRLTKAVALLGCGVALGRATNAYLERVAPGGRSEARRLGTLLATTFAVTAPYVWVPQTPGYNDLTSVLVFLVAWSALRLATPAATGARQLRIHALLGVCTWGMLLTKWPVGLLVGLGLTIGYAVRWRAWRQAAACSGAFLLSMLATHLLLAPISSIVTGLNTGNETVGEGHQSSTLIRDYWHDLSTTPQWTVQHRPLTALLVILAALGFALVGPSRRTSRSAIAFGLIFPFAFLAEGGDQRGQTLIIAQSIFSIVLLLLLFAALFGLVSALISQRSVPPGEAPAEAQLDAEPTDAPWSGRWAPRLISGGLLVAPLAAAAGTGNAILVVAMFLTPLWLIGVIILVDAEPHSSDAVRLAVTAAAFSLSVVIALAGADGTWNHPYRQPPLSEATTRVDVGPFEGLRVDPITAGAIEDVNAFVDASGADVLVSIGAIPGLVASTGRPQPIFGWVNPIFPSRIERSLTAACEASRTVALFVLEPTGDVASYEEYCPAHDWTPGPPTDVPAGPVATWLITRSD